ncbi:MAG: hypothetical protein NUV34_03350 [Sulfuricaulis sp.]|nr:hypothetical protein [Sulfuricaulis sp.]
MRVTPESYGAVGDGISDDTAAIIASVASGRDVEFSETYRITQPLSFAGLSRFSLYGHGTIRCDATAVFNDHAIKFFPCDHFEVVGITCDQNNNPSFNNKWAMLEAISCTDFKVKESEFIHFTFIGCGANSCQKFWIKDNYIKKDIPENTRNYSINVGSNLSTSTGGEISGNLTENAGSGYTGYGLTISDNKFKNYKYGAGIATFGDGTAAFGSHAIHGNNCSFGSGTDIDGQVASGMEIGGFYCSVDDNICIGNAGIGIKSFSLKSGITNNKCHGNGTAGIMICYGSSALFSGGYSHVSGNYCRDLGAGTQLYGYYENHPAIRGMQLAANTLQGITQDMYIQGDTVVR